MSEQANQLREYYERQDTEELIEMSVKDLTDEARVVLNQVLGARGAQAEIEQQQQRVARKMEADRQFNERLGDRAARLMAFAIDVVGGFVLAFAVLLPLRYVSEQAYGMAVAMTWWLYMLFRDAPTGQSLGKALLRLRVVGVETGKKCTWAQSLWRNLPHVFFWIDALFMLGNRRMRLGDMMARTMVVKASVASQKA